MAIKERISPLTISKEDLSFTNEIHYLISTSSRGGTATSVKIIQNWCKKKTPHTFT